MDSDDVEEVGHESDAHHDKSYNGPLMGGEVPMDVLRKFRPAKRKNANQAKGEYPRDDAQGVVFGHERFDHDEVEAVGDGIDKDEKVAQGRGTAHGIVFAITDKTDGSQKTNPNTRPLNPSCLLFQYDNGERGNDNGGENHDDGTMKWSGNGETVEEEELVDGYTAQAAKCQTHQILT